MNPLAREDEFGAATRRDTELSAVSSTQKGEAPGRRVRELQAQILNAQNSRLGSQALPTHPDLRPLLPGGAIQAGSVYCVRGSKTLGLTMLSAASTEGAWCALLGFTDVNAEAAAAFGIELKRLILVPQPGEQWLTVAAALLDVVQIVLIQAPGRVTAGQAARLSARLRQRGAVLISTGSWPQAEAELSIVRNNWQGLGQGHGHLRGRQITISASWRSRRGQPDHQGSLWLPGSVTDYPLPTNPGTEPSTLGQPAAEGYPALTMAASQ